jgi:hypothetical protein
MDHFCFKFSHFSFKFWHFSFKSWRDISMTNPPPPVTAPDPLKDEASLTQLALLMSYSNQPAVAEFTHMMTAASSADPNKERDRIATRLNGFNSKDNIAWKAIAQKFGNSVKQAELLSMAQVVASQANIKLDRDAKRRKSVLIKWFEENWVAIEPFLQYLVLEEPHG